MAHFVKPLGAKSDGFKVRSDGALTSMTIGPIGSTKVVVLWGGGRGGEILKLAAFDNGGNRLATTRNLGQEKGHKPDPDGDDQWYYRYELKTIGEGTGTLTAVDSTGMPFARIALIGPTPVFTKIEQVLKDGKTAKKGKEASVVPGSEIPYRPRVARKVLPLSQGFAEASVHLLRFKIEKAGSTFWVGACVPAGTTDFSRAYVFFHPNTMKFEDNATYTAFTDRWPSVERYTSIHGVQLGSVKKMVLIVPFMTLASGANTPATNIFASRPVDSLNRIMEACQTAVGAASKGTKLSSIGVASFSSGIEHMVRFVSAVGGSGLVKEQVDFDSAHITLTHSHAVRLKDCRNIQVTQVHPSLPRVAPHLPAYHEWFVLGSEAWNVAPADTGVMHESLGKRMFRIMMMSSTVK